MKSRSFRNYVFVGCLVGSKNCQELGVRIEEWRRENKFMVLVELVTLE